MAGQGGTDGPSAELVDTVAVSSAAAAAVAASAAATAGGTASSATDIAVAEWVGEPATSALQLGVGRGSGQAGEELTEPLLTRVEIDTGHVTCDGGLA